jgi:membrane protease subunit HflK
VARERLYLQTMQLVLSHSNKVIIDAKGATAPIILPPDAFRPRTASDPSIAPAPQAAAPAAAPADGAQ